ncbi:MAG TPA: sulfite exporter TauE/SafE family protein [Acidimicrobiales bacterium]|nr:sulfite exporter TauE/SafE family protein [Acidimicrobiales bacterium]
MTTRRAGEPGPSVGRSGLVGAIAGALSGLFGVGGGIVIVPGLTGLTKMTQRMAHGVSLAAIVPIAAAGALGYLLDAKVSFAVAALLVSGSLVGAWIGTHLLSVLPQRTLRVGFAAILVATGLRFLLAPGGVAERGDALLPDWSAVVIGLVAGVLSGLLGVGGGIVMVPAMMLLLGMSAVVAKGTSLLVILPTALLGTYRNRHHGNTDLRVAAAVGIGGVITAFGASRVSIGLDPTLSAVLFGALMSIVGGRMVALDVIATRRDRADRLSEAAPPTGPAPD